MLLEELGLPYKLTKLEFTEVKNPEYVKINPNGRLPAIKDPNTGITLWEVRWTFFNIVEQSLKCFCSPPRSFSI